MKKYVLLTLLLAACSSIAPVAEAPIDLRIMTFNIEWGGKHVSFDNVIEAIRIARADVVGVQEAEGNLEELASSLGWHFDERNYVISRFPLIDPPEANGRYALVEVRPGQVVAIANLHLPDAPYGPDLLRDSKNVDAVIANENRVRVPALSGWLDRLRTPIAQGIPVFVTGDFNSPSHQDSEKIKWPVTVAMEKAGLVDAWRQVYPNAAAVPGLTWWAARPEIEHYAPGENDPEDRIDMIWSSDGAISREAELVGEVGRSDIAYSVDPWPSDHRAVIAEFSVTPAPAPDYLSTDRRVYSESQRVTVRFNFTTEQPGYLRVSNSGSPFSSRIPIPSTSDTLALPVLEPGAYEVSATTAGRVHSRHFWVLQDGAVPHIEATKAVFEAGEPVTIRWRDGPGFRNDYIAVYAQANANDLRDMSHYVYVDALPEGEMDLRKALAVSGDPLLPGRYVVRLMKDDGYEALADSRSVRVR